MGGSWEHQKVLDWGRSGTCWCVLRAIVAIYFLVNFSTCYFPVNSNCALSICSCRTHWPTAVILMNVCFHLVRCLDQRSGRIGMVSSLESRVNPGVKELPWPCMGTKGSCCPSVSLWGSFGMCGRGVASVVTGHLLSCPKATSLYPKKDRLEPRPCLERSHQISGQKEAGPWPHGVWLFSLLRQPSDWSYRSHIHWWLLPQKHNFSTVWWTAVWGFFFFSSSFSMCGRQRNCPRKMSIT